MIAQAILSLLLSGVLVYAWAEYRRSPVVASLSVAVSLAGLFFVWVPSESTRVAELVGIGRGADLILYLWVCISLIVLLNLHLKLRTQQEMITKLARAIALANVVTPHVDVMGAVPDVPQPQTGAPPAAHAHRSTQMDDQIA
jgi:small membrane protein